MDKVESCQPASSQNQFPSFSKSSCTGTDSGSDPEHDLTTRNGSDCVNNDIKPQKERRRGGRGGYTCCVPGCYSNSKKDKHLSFYNFPEGKSSEKQMLRKRWIHAVSRKDFQPTIGHRVCSLHFEGGCKTYMNNVPTITPKLSKQVKPKPRSTTKARDREFYFQWKRKVIQFAA